MFNVDESYYLDNNLLFFVQIVVGRKEFKWTINNFDDLLKIGKPIVSSKFTVDRSDSSKAEHFYIELQPKKVNSLILFDFTWLNVIKAELKP